MRVSVHGIVINRQVYGFSDRRRVLPKLPATTVHGAVRGEKAGMDSVRDDIHRIRRRQDAIGRTNRPDKQRVGPGWSWWYSNRAL